MARSTRLDIASPVQVQETAVQADRPGIGGRAALSELRVQLAAVDPVPARQVEATLFVCHTHPAARGERPVPATDAGGVVTVPGPLQRTRGLCAGVEARVVPGAGARA